MYFLMSSEILVNFDHYLVEYAYPYLQVAVKVLPLIWLARQHTLIWAGWLKKSRHVEKVKSFDIDKQKQQQSTFRQNLPIGLGFRILFIYQSCLQRLSF